MTLIVANQSFQAVSFDFAFDTASIATGVQINAAKILKDSRFNTARIIIKTAFNATGANMVNIGISAGGGEYATNLSIAGAADTVIDLPKALYAAALNADRDFYVRYSQTGTAATTGAATILMLLAKSTIN